MSETWFMHVWIGEEVLLWGETDGAPFEVRLTGEEADSFSAAEDKAEGIIRRAGRDAIAKATAK